MAQKPTSLAAHVAKTEAAKAAAEDQEDAKLVRKAAPKGKVWVRLIRPHYDAEGIYHDVGPALLVEGKVPSSAKILTKERVEEEPPEGEDE